MTTYYVDFENGNDANNGLTFATRKKTIASATTSWARGDVVRVMASPAPTALGVDGTWTQDSSTVTLSAAVTKTIDNCESGWVAAANVTATHTSSRYRQGSSSIFLTPAGAFTTGLMAYKDLGSAVDFSAYEQVNLWIWSVATRVSGFYTLRLCSDAAGVTAVDTLTIPALEANTFQKVVINKGSALGASIQSVALYAGTDPGTSGIYLDNIFASKAVGAADELTLFSLISTNNGSPNDDPWLPVQCIDETTITLHGVPDGNQLIPGTAKYSLATQTTPAYVRQPIALTAPARIETVLATGDGTYGYVSGGWNRTDMSTRTDKTHITRTGYPGNSAFIINSSRDFCWVSNFAASDIGGFAYGFYSGSVSDFSTFSNCDVLGCVNGFAFEYGAWSSLNESDGPNNSYFCKRTLVTLGNPNSDDIRSQVFRFNNVWGSGTEAGVYAFYSNNTLARRYACELYANEIYNAYSAIGSVRGGGELVVNLFNATLKDLTVDIDIFGEVYLWKTTHDDLSVPMTSLGTQLGIVHGTELTDAGTSTVTPSLYYNARRGGAVVRRSQTERHTASDYSWELNFDDVAIDYDQSSFVLCQIACPENESRTIRVWAYRANTESIARIRVKGGRYDGVPDDLTDELTTSGDWEQLELTFTPTEDIVVEVFMEAKYISNAATRKLVYFDDLTVI